MKIRLAIIIAVILLCGLLFLRPDTSDRADIPSGPVTLDGSNATQTMSATQPTTMPDTQVPTQTVTSTSGTVATQPTTVPATTQPPTTQPPTTQPTTAAPEPTKPDTQNTKVLAFVSERMDTWHRPIKEEFAEVVGSRTFASSRGGGKRAHAGLDFVAPHGTKVYAITGGTVQRVALFYQNTYAVEVCNDDGSILRYCEISTDLQAGDRVEQGQIIGKILRANSGTEMLHMEVYYGDAEGMLTQTGNKTYTYLDDPKNFLRRSDLLDPTFLKDLKVG